MKIKLSATLIILGAVACLGADEAGVKPVSAVVIDPKFGQPVKDQRMMLGNTKRTFRDDGQSEVVSADGQCMPPAVSKKGVTGWIDSANAKLISGRSMVKGIQIARERASVPPQLELRRQ
jgi:hypothetical protein